MSTPRFGFNSGGHATFAEIGAWAAHCERIGAEVMMVGEAPTEFEDPFVHLGLLARATTTMRVGTAVTTPGLRHPAVVANAFSTIHKLSGGRAVLGIGTGDLGLIHLGEKPYQLAAFEEYVRTLSALTAGHEVVYRETRLRISWSAGQVPLWFAADGPRMLELAGRFADGVIVGQAGHPDIVRFVRHHVGMGAAAAGRSLDDIEIWYMLRAVVTEEENAAVRMDGLDEYAARQAHFLWRISGSPSEDDVIEQVRRRKGLTLDADMARRLARYGTQFKGGEAAWGSKANVELLDRCGLTDWAGRTFYVSGPPAHLADRVRELTAAGAGRFLVPSVGARTLDERITWTESVANVLRSLP